MTRYGVVLWLAVACGETHVGSDLPTCDSGESLAFTIRLVAQQTAIEGASPGIDLDGFDSDETDPRSCNQPDFVDPIDGERGVDNQLFQTTAGSLDPPPPFPPDLFVDLEIRHVDDWGDDTCIQVVIGDLEPVTTELVGGRFRALTAGGAIEFLFEEGDNSFRLPVTAPAVEGTLGGDGALTDVVFAGRIRIEDALAALHEQDPTIDPSFARATLESVADLDADADGDCQSVSAVFVTEVVP